MKRKLFLLAFLGAVSASCMSARDAASPGDPSGQSVQMSEGQRNAVPVPEVDLDLYELAFREGLRTLEALRTNEVVFLAFGEDAGTGKYRDPPAGFLARFNDLQHALYVPSDAQYGEIEPGRWWGNVTHKVSKQEGRIYFVKIKSVTGHEVLLEVGFYGGGLYGGGLEYRATQENGVWTLTLTGHGWVS